jgi:hypothetical protein
MDFAKADLPIRDLSLFLFWTQKQKKPKTKSFVFKEGTKNFLKPSL